MTRAHLDTNGCEEQYEPDHSWPVRYDPDDRKLSKTALTAAGALGIGFGILLIAVVTS